MQQVSVVERFLKRDRMLLGLLIGLLFVLAGIYTIVGVGMNMSALEMTAMRGMRDMAGPRTPGDWSLAYAGLVFLMWWVMMIAMMLPSIAPMVLLHSALARRCGRGQSTAATSLMFLCGYLAGWGGFALAATIAQWAMEWGGMVSPSMMTLIESVPGGVVLIAAGIFQFTSLKETCLEHCRSPVRFLTERGRAGAGGAFRMGVEHGSFCVTCCWGLMALLFVGGIMNLFWIVGLAAFVALERLSPVGPRLSRYAGAVLVIWGCLVIAASLWPHT
ncbi:putative metal-binding membrane protein [Aliiruegeria haliotis]|uniref:Putative metal-binding membrane protein n=1 Tax=Aliiruegeria haliotis TaxID=1280846 RepID=A0A2T0RN71_9RHOB|nr:DUF2182 domain-containing protein [Aliiruegeria haliotis]PRY22572.1 putative metal-binding membrane protein [Aliiruegeria haliotis]